MDTAAVPGLEHLPPSLRGFLVSTPYTGSCDGRVSKQYGIFDEFTHNSEHRKLLASYHTGHFEWYRRSYHFLPRCGSRYKEVYTYTSRNLSAGPEQLFFAKNAASLVKQGT